MTSSLMVTIPAAVASGSHQLGEESPLVLFAAARALDGAGSGRVRLDDLWAEVTALFSRKQFDRVINSEQGARYWEHDRFFLRLRSSASIVQTFPCEILPSLAAARFPLALLNTRPRRGAALLAAMLAGIDVPRSNQFINRFAGVDRKTVARWMRDPVIAEQILLRIPQWAEA